MHISTQSPKTGPDQIPEIIEGMDCRPDCLYSVLISTRIPDQFRNNSNKTTGCTTFLATAFNYTASI